MEQEAAKVLDLLYVTDETFTTEEIAAATDLSVSDVEQALTLLEEQGFVRIGIKGVDASTLHLDNVEITSDGAMAVESYRPQTDTSGLQYEPVPDYWGAHGRA